METDAPFATRVLYTQDDHDEKQAAHGAFLSAVGLRSRLVQWLVDRIVDLCRDS